MDKIYPFRGKINNSNGEEQLHVTNYDFTYDFTAALSADTCLFFRNPFTPRKDI
jgi:hypothetical protein